MTAEAVPRQVGRYDILGAIGRGGLGVVYRARTRGPADATRVSALKLIHDHLSADQHFVLMFLDEMRIAMGLALAERSPEGSAGERGAAGEDFAIEFYDVMSQLLYVPSTPTLFHAGTSHPQMSSSYITTVDDDLGLIMKAVADNAQLSKWSGGLGNDWTGDPRDRRADPRRQRLDARPAPSRSPLRRAARPALRPRRLPGRHLSRGHEDRRELVSTGTGRRPRLPHRLAGARHGAAAPGARPWRRTAVAVSVDHAVAARGGGRRADVRAGA